MRVSKINASAPDCSCEKYRMSKHSPNPIENTEVLARFVFVPIHIDKKGKIKPAAFSHVYDRGCSIHREKFAENTHALALIQRTLDIKKDAVWKGVLLGRCGDVRAIKADSGGHRTVCAYDTADDNNVAHGELCQTQYVIEEADRIELRHDLLEVFDNGKIISPLEYKNGEILNLLPETSRARC